MRKTLILSAMLIALAACGKKESAEGSGSDEATQTSGGSGDSEAKPVKKSKLRVGDRTLSNPNAQQVAFAYYQISRLPAPTDAWAADDPRVRAANEFDRAQVAANVKEEIMASAEAVDGVGFFQLGSETYFGEYDSTVLGYRLKDLDEGRYFYWDYNGQRYKISIENAAEAQLWKIPPDEARAALEKTSSRAVRISMVLEIVGAMPDGSGGIIQTKVKSYEVFAPDYSGGTKLGAASFK